MCLLDMVCIALIVMGTAMCVYQLAQNGFDIDKLLFEEEDNDD